MQESIYRILLHQNPIPAYSFAAAKSELNPEITFAD